MQLTQEGRGRSDPPVLAPAALQVCPANWQEGAATIKPNPKESLE